MRLRIVELLTARGMTPYRLSKASGGRISMSCAYRLYRAKGRFGYVKASVLDALCDVLRAAPSDLLER